MSHKEFQRKSTHMTDTSASGHRPTLLFVDDEPDFLSSLEDYFSAFAEVYTAADTTTALTIVETNKPDVIICDLRLKETMNGIEFLEKTIAISPDSERILITAFGDIHSMINAINRARLSYYLNKPVDFHQLKMAVLQLIVFMLAHHHFCFLLKINHLQVLTLQMTFALAHTNCAYKMQ